MPQTETRAEWLASLKVGDEVAIPMAGADKVATITDQTKATWVIGERCFGKIDGVEVGGGWEWSRPPAIEPVTADVLDRIKRQDAVRTFRDITGSLDKFDTATLEAAIAVLKGESNAD